MSKPELSIIIPAYNEASRLPATLRTLQAYIAARPRLTEVIIVDDGSRDATVQLAEQAFPSATILRHGRNRGKGAAVRTGMLAAHGEWRYLCDADLSTPIEDLEKLWAFRDRAEVIIGSRRAAGANMAKRQPLWRVLIGQIGNVIIQALVVPGIKDTQCGFKLFHERTLDIFRLQRNDRFGYDFELLYLARRFGWRIQEVPVSWYNDERTKVRGVDYFITFWELLKIHLNRFRGYYQRP